jgi:hypothetical protein
MADQAQPQDQSQASTVVVPEDLRAEHSELIELVLHSESMNDEERQYWINILPIMTPEQVKNLNEILTNEKTQLAAIDAKYSKEIEQMGQKQFVEQMEQERQKRADERTQAEQSAKQQEDQATDSILKQIEGA